MRLLLLAALALSTCSLAQTSLAQTPAPHDHAAPMTAPMNMAAHGHASAEAGLAALSGIAFDRAYLSMMIAHHEAGAQMSEALLARSRDEQVRTWAREVILAQRNEIREMTAFLRDEGLAPDAAARNAMAREMRPMIDEVKAAQNPDDAWVRLMIAHHAQGIRMATLALAQAQADRVRLSAQGVVRVQAEQMYEYRAWAPGT